jgi:YggT family protein
VNITCTLAQFALYALNIYLVLMLIYALVSWIPSLRGRWVDYLAMIIEPLLQPLRRVIPPLGGLDLSFLVLILAFQYLLRPLIINSIGHACYVSY